MSVLRIIPITGTEIEREAAAASILPNELTTTNDQRRLFLQNYLVGSVWHPGVTSQADMLNLWRNDERGCWPGDLCQRTDSSEIYGCMTNNGQQLADWILLVAAGLTVDAPLAGSGTPVSHLSIPAATDEVPGHLTAADHAAFAAKVSLVAVPASGDSPGAVGQIAVDDDHLYAFTPTTGWKFTLLMELPT